LISVRQEGNTKIHRRVSYVKLGINVFGHRAHRGDSGDLWHCWYGYADRMDLVRRLSHSLRGKHNHWASRSAGLKDAILYEKTLVSALHIRTIDMWHLAVLVLTSLLTVGSLQEVAARPLAPPVAAGEHCEQTMTTNKPVIVGLY